MSSLDLARGRSQTRAARRQDAGPTGEFGAALAYLDVRWFGGGPGKSVAVNNAAIAAALSELAGPGALYFCKGQWDFDATILRRNGTVLRGDGPGVTVLHYTGTGTAVAPLTPGARSYLGGIFDCTIQTTTGEVGVDLDGVSSAEFDRVDVKGFTGKAFWLHSAISGGCVYNRFANTLAQAPAMPNTAYGYKLDALSTNANVFLACRANLCNVGWHVADSNDNTMAFCQAEGGGTGFHLTATAPGLADDNRMIGCRAEYCAVYGFDVASVNVRDTHIWFAWVGSNGTPVAAAADYHDVGTRTSYDPQLTVNAAGTLISARGVGAPAFALTSTSGQYQAATAAALFMRGNIPNTGSNVANWFGNVPTLSGGTYVAGFCRDSPVTHAQVAARVRNDGAWVYENGVIDLAGTGSPEGVVPAPPGSTFRNLAGGAGVSFWVKESGAGATGWIGK